MKIKYLILSVVVFGVSLFAQVEDKPFYLPYNTGNVWEYFWVEFGYPDTFKITNITDSVDSEGNIFFRQYERWINPEECIAPDACYYDYFIDTNYQVYKYGYGNFHIYNLEAKKGEEWIVWIEENLHARVEDLYQDTIFGKPARVMGIKYFVPLDSTDTLGYVWYYELLADSIGMIYQGGGESIADLYLKGAFVNGLLYGDTTKILVSIKEDIQKNLPNEYKFFQNYPNPFNPATIIRYEVPNKSNITIKIYNIMGQLLETLIDEEKTQGEYEVKFEGANLPSGIYFARIQTENYSKTIKMILTK